MDGRCKARLPKMIRHHPLLAQLAARRVELNMSQSLLSDKTGYSQKAIADWEQGTRAPDLRKACKIAEALGMELTLTVKEVSVVPLIRLKEWLPPNL